MSANLVSPEASLFGLQLAIFSLCLHMAFSPCICIHGISPSSGKDTSPLGLGNPAMVSFNLSYFLKGSVSKLKVRN